MSTVVRGVKGFLLWLAIALATVGLTLLQKTPVETFNGFILIGASVLLVLLRESALIKR